LCIFAVPSEKAISKPEKMLKTTFLTLMIFIGLNLYSQQGCDIFIRYPDDTTGTVYMNDTTLCFKTRLFLFTQISDTVSYSWEPTGETGPITNPIDISESVTYILNGYNADSSYHCTDTLLLDMYETIVIEFEQLVFGCPPTDTIKGDTICKGQVKANAEGGYPPYHFSWGDSATYVTINPGDSSWALNLCMEQTYSVTVRDTFCAYIHEYEVLAYDMPDIEVTITPDSLFVTNPQALLSFENKTADSIPLTTWAWIFPDGTSTNQLNPTYVFLENDSLVKFTYTTINNCNDTIFVPVDVREFELTIYNVFTPNGDGVNDKYEIPYLDRYISNHLYIYNRWGELVYEKDNYNDEWDGGKLPDGVYFYILKCQGYWEEDIFRGSVSIYGSNY
jgi:gliding motility-associated-like protein